MDIEFEAKWIEFPDNLREILRKQSLKHFIVEMFFICQTQILIRH